MQNLTFTIVPSAISKALAAIAAQPQAKITHILQRRAGEPFQITVEGFQLWVH